MAEWLIVATFIAGAIFAIRTVGGRPLSAPIQPDSSRGDGVDLPCPWCRAETAESDTRCPGCGRRFG